MAKKVFGICDLDRTYAQRFANYIWKKERGLFEVRAFTEPAVLEAYLQEGFLDAVLLTEDFLSGLQPAAAEVLFAESAAAVLTESRDGDHYRRSIYRYQSADRILGEIMGEYARVSARESEAANLKTRVYGIYSPIRHCFKSSLSIALSQVLSERGRTLLLSFEDLCGHRMLICGQERRGLSELLYAQMTDGAGTDLSGVTESTAAGDYVPAAASPEDIRQTPPEIFRAMIDSIAADSGYRYLVIDMGDALTDPLPGLQACDRIFVPVRDDEISVTKLEVWQMWLRQRGVRDIQRKLRTVRFSEETYSPEMLRRCAEELADDDMGYERA